MFDVGQQLLALGFAFTGSWMLNLVIDVLNTRDGVLSGKSWCKNSLRKYGPA
jgi:hypothetical protein